jgi:HSP20 family protein
MDYFLGGTNGPMRTTFPRTNVYVSDESAVFTAEIPGFDPQEIEISVQNKTLTLSGNHKGDELDETNKVRRQERINRDFSRSFELPFRVDVNAIQAKFTNGVLSVELSRLPEEKPKKIIVNAS